MSSRGAPKASEKKPPKASEKKPPKAKRGPSPFEEDGYLVANVIRAADETVPLVYAGALFGDEATVWLVSDGGHERAWLSAREDQ